MCGIFGYVGSIPTPDVYRFAKVIKEGFIASMLRGEDSSGFVTIPNKVGATPPVIIKRPICGYDFIHHDIPQKHLSFLADYKGIIAHVRAATRGAITQQNAHPFNSEHIILVHNGTLNNIHSIGSPNVDTDSEAIARHLATSPDYKDTLCKLQGAFALAWYNLKENRVYLSRNDERPLFFGVEETTKSVVFASEFEMLDWLLVRNGFKVKTYYSIEPNNTVIINPDTPSNYVMEKFEPIKIPAAKTYSINNRKPTYVGDSNPKINYVTKRELSENLPVKVSQKIEVQVTSIYLPEKKSRHGVFEGVMTDSPFWRVIMRNMDTRELKKGTIYSGHVASILEPKSTWPTVYITSIKNEDDLSSCYDVPVVYEKYKELMHNPVLNKNLKKEVPKHVQEANKETSQLPALLEPEKGKPDDIIMVDGLRMSRKAWKQLTEHGCSNCVCDLHTPQETYIRNGFAFCETCIKIPLN